MIKYIGVVALLIIFYELIGQSVNSLFKVKQLPFNFFVGFMSHMAIAYVALGIKTARGISFKLLVIVHVLICLGLIALIIYKRKNLKINFKWWELIILIVIAYLPLTYTCRTALGDFHGFDVGYYLNLVVGAIGKDNINNFSTYYGNVNDRAATTSYLFQSYYYFCSVVTWASSKAFNYFNIQNFYAVNYIWIFQILFTLSLMSIFVNSIRRFLKGKPILIVFIFFVITYYNARIYWNNIYGFFGNSYRGIAICYLTYYTVELLVNRDKNYRPLLTICILSGCAFSSSFAFIAFMHMMALFFMWVDNDEHIFIWYGLSLFYPLINIGVVITESRITTSSRIGILFLVVMIALNYALKKIVKYKYFKQVLFVFVVSFMVLMSYKTCGSFFNLDAIIANNSEKADMTLQYFDWDYFKVYKYIALIITTLFLVLRAKNKYAILCWIMIITMFNPFCAGFLNKVNAVYYRAWDLVFNPFLMIYFLSELDSIFKGYDCVAVLLEISCTCLIFNTINFNWPDWFHASFETPENFDVVNKMTRNDEDIIIELKRLIEENELDNPFIITPDLKTYSMLGDGKYMYCREYRYGGGNNESYRQIYQIFYPVNYYNEISFEDNDYEHIINNLKEIDVDILVVKKNMDYYNEEGGYFDTLYNLIQINGIYPSYQNDEYCIFLVNSNE